MPIIGYDTIGVNSDATQPNWQNECLVGATERYTAVSGDVVTEVAIYGDADGTAEVGVYTYVGGVPVTRVGSGTITIGTAAQWWTQTVNIALTAGVEYVVGVDWYASAAYNMRYDDPGSGTNTSVGTGQGALPATWTQSTTSTGLGSFYALVGSPAQNADVTAAVVTIAAEVPAPTVALSAGPPQTTMEIPVEVPAPNVTAGGSASVDAEVVTIAASVGTAAVAVGQGVVATVVETPVNVLQAVLTEPPWPTSISGRRIRDQNGDVYLLKTFSSWAMASNLSNTEITDALEDVAALGFNGVTVWMGGGYDIGSGWHQYTNDAGQSFWTGTPWASSLGPAWASVDHLMTVAAGLGLTVSFSFCGGFGTTGARPDWEAATNLQMYNVGVAVATRYAAYPNIIWHVMLDDVGDPSSTVGQRVNALFDGINDTEGASARPVRWMEPNNGSSINSQGWLGTTEFNATMNGLYDYDNNSTEIAEACRNEAGATTVPWGDTEPPYDGSPHYGASMGQQLRERSWVVFIEGGSYVNYGHEDWWPFGASGLFTESGVGTWTAVMAHNHTIFQSHCWFLVDLVCADTSYDHDNGAFLTSGVGSGDTKAAAGFSNTAAIAYFPNSRSIIVDTTVLAGTGPVQLRWYDPTSRGFTTIATSEAQTSGRAITYPAGNNSAGNTDWVLLVNTVANPAPDPVALAVNVPTPTVTTSGTDVNVGPSVVAAVVDVPAPAVGAGAAVSLAVVETSVSVPTPAIQAGGGADVTAAVVTAAVGVITPAAVGATASPEPASVDTAVVVPAPTVTAGSRATPSTVEASAEVLLPVLIGDPITLHRLRCPPASWG